MTEAGADAINQPPHYRSGGLEAIDVIEAFGCSFHIGNVMKYLLRAGNKGGEAKRLEDYKKAAWYLARAISRLENSR